MENNNYDVTPASFGGLYSTNDIWVGNDEEQCLTDTLETMESDIAGKAPTEHTHTGYAPTEHEHTGYADEEHTHTGYAPTSHTHAQSDITGLTAQINTFVSALTAKADASALTAKADLVDGKVPASQLPSYVDDVAEYDNLSAFPTAGESGKVYLAKDTNKAYRWGGTTYVEIAGGVALGETAATAHRGDHGKIAYDHSQNTAVHVTEAQKTAWDGKAEGNHEHDYADEDHSHLGWSGASASTYKLVYVATNGNDENDGFSTSAPMATIRGVIRKYAEKYKMLDIRLADGTYNEDLGAIAVDVPNLSIRSISENKDAVIINTATQLDLNSGLVRMYNMTINVTATGVRGISLNAGSLYAYGLRINVPEASTTSCINIYNGCTANLMNCVLNSGTGSNAGAAVYGNQALYVKVIGCTSERNVNIGVHAHNGSDIVYTDTFTATTKTKETSYGKCTLRA